MLPERVRSLLDHPLFGWVSKPLGTMSFLGLAIWPLLCCELLCCWLFGIVVVDSDPPHEKWMPVKLNWIQFNRIHIFDNIPLVGGSTFDAARAYNEWDRGDFPWDGALPFVLVFGLLHMFAHMAALLFALIFDFISRNMHSVEAVKSRLARDTCLTLVAFVSGCVGGFLFYIVMVTVLWPLHHQPYAVATVGPPLMVLLFIIAAYSEVGLLGGILHEDEREWWARVTAFLMIHALAWFVVFGSAIYLPYLVQSLNKAIALNVTPGLVLAWLATAMGGAMAGHSPGTGGKVKNQVLDLLAGVGPSVFLIGLLAAMSWLVQVWIVNIDPYNDFLEEVTEVFSKWKTPEGGIGPDMLAYWFLGSLAIGGLMTRFINVNVFSFHAMYANRLIRCYLGDVAAEEEWLLRWRKGIWHPGGAGHRRAARGRSGGGRS